MQSRLIIGVAGTDLTNAEAGFIRETRPCGFILFSRNCASVDQIRSLIDSFVEAAENADTLVLIDQEGGRVQRLRPPLGRALPPAASYAALYQTDPDRALGAARAVAQLVGRDLRDLGINTVCAPVLDIPVEGAHDVIGDRAFGRTSLPVTALGRAVAEGFMAAGVVPVIKHIPGHGRATADSHFDLPVVSAPHAQLTQTDFAPFRALNDMPAAMTAHVVFAALDPNKSASVSSRVTAEIIRGEIGFDGLLMSDDISMRALKGEMRDRASAVLAAGSDVVLHCNGDLAEMQAASSRCPALSGEGLARFERALAVTERHDPLDTAAAERKLSEMLTICAKPVESV